jgi:hypothetical protein
MTHATCAVEDRDGVCGAPTRDFLCSKHRTELAMWLWDVAGNCLGDSMNFCDSLLRELDTTICRDDKIGGASIGIVVCNGEQGLLFNSRASDIKEALVRAVRLWALRFAEENPHLRFDPATIEDAALWMAGFPNLLAGHHQAVAMHADIRDLVLRARRVIDRPAQKVYLGECGGMTEKGPCTAALFGLQDRLGAHCFECGSDWLVDARRQTMLSGIEDKVAHSGNLAALVKANGVPLASSTVRNYARRGKIVSVGVDARKRPLYRVGDVLDVLLSRVGEAA